jgi:2-methylcitrate dehydratase PrpD
VLDGQGFLFAFSGGEIDQWPGDLVLGEPFAIVDPGFEQKRYPCCYLLHKVIESTLALKRRSGLGLEDVASARVDVPQGGTSALIHPYPKTGLNALFSGPYAVVACLADGGIDLKSFTDESVLRPQIQSRLHDVVLVEASTAARSGSDVGGGGVTVTLRPRRGTAISHTVTVSPGSPKDPLTVDQSRVKWLDCLQRVRPEIEPALARALFEDGAGLAEAPAIDHWVRRVGAALRAG